MMLRLSDKQPGGGVQVQRCYKRLIRLIYDRFAQPGAALPPQQVLRDLLSVSNDTISAAMRRLVDEGVLTRKPRVGTLVADIERIPPVPWIVGVATIDAPEVGERAFYAHLLHVLQVRLSQTGCRCTTYVRKPSAIGKYHRIDNFLRLREDLEQGDLDGLVFLTNLDRDEWTALNDRLIPVCHAGLWGDAPRGAVIDLAGFRAGAIQALRNRGCQRICTVGQLDVQVEGANVYQAFHSNDDNGIPHFDSSEGIESGKTFARRLLAEPAMQPFDGLIVIDDYAAAGLATELRTNGRALPLMAVKTNRQRPVDIGPAALPFELDIDELGLSAANVLLATLHGRFKEDAPVFIPLRVTQQ